MLYARVYVCMASVEMTDVLSMHMHPHGGITAPFETDVYIDSTAPATRNRLRPGSVEYVFFGRLQMVMLKTAVWTR